MLSEILIISVSYFSVNNRTSRFVGGVRNITPVCEIIRIECMLAAARSESATVRVARQPLCAARVENLAYALL